MRAQFTPINAQSRPSVKIGLHRLKPTNVTGIALLIDLRFLAGWALDLGANFSSTLIAQRSFVS
jgi:hypothetical protein